ncbi:unnamed protein product [Oikopleura dioica]|uniref:Uncharacterized protein n=1 Tax=Oikopleura dioica TaxID=34765 RepID=E4XHX3_OIKDI|nr:unnamed protein product [Oikopleura dioica]
MRGLAFVSLVLLFNSNGSSQLEKRSGKKSMLECDILSIADIQKRKKKDIPKLDKIYNGFFYLNMNRGRRFFWERSAENDRGQLLELFITKGKVRVGEKRKLRPAWLIGYTQPGTGHFVVRYFAFGNLNCRKAHSIVHWNQIKNLSAFKNLRRIQIRKNNVRHVIFQLSNLSSQL